MKLLDALGLEVGTAVSILLVLSLILLVAVIVLGVRLGEMIRKYKRFMAKEAGASFERRMLDRITRVGELEEQYDKMQNDMRTIERAVRSSYQKCSIVKYNAFREATGNISFVLCLLDHNNSGILLNSMYANDGCYSYIKELKFGNCEIPLSEEETQALKEAIAKGNILREKDLFA
ncbi:MAG: DUF4446 family protein [Lachnospiraceae bacterium]|nr:DUF4446 family protein [Lachnospiraceae bacterium]